jgi:hypothetical protein
MREPLLMITLVITVNIPITSNLTGGSECHIISR